MARGFPPPIHYRSNPHRYHFPPLHPHHHTLPQNRNLYNSSHRCCCFHNRHRHRHHHHHRCYRCHHRLHRHCQARRHHHRSGNHRHRQCHPIPGHWGLHPLRRPVSRYESCHPLPLLGRCLPCRRDSAGPQPCSRVVSDASPNHVCSSQNCPPVLKLINENIEDDQYFTFCQMNFAVSKYPSILQIHDIPERSVPNTVSMYPCVLEIKE